MTEDESTPRAEQEDLAGGLDRAADNEVAGSGLDHALTPRHSVRRIFFGADGLRAGWSLLVFLLLLAALIIPGHRLISARHTDAASVSAQPREQSVRSSARQDGVMFLIVLLASVAMSRIERRPLAAYGIGWTRGGLGQFLAGLGWGLGFLSLLVLTLRGAHLLVFDGRLLTGGAILRFGAEWAAGFLLVGLFEEYFLRGFLQFTLARGFSGIYGAMFGGSVAESRHRDALGFWTAAVLLAFVFGLGHRSNPGESSIGLLTAGAAALVFALSLWRTGSLWWAIGFHASWDWAQSFLFGVADSGLIMQHRLFATHPLGRPIWSGGLTGPEGSVFVLVVLLLAAGAIRVTLAQVRRGNAETV